MSEIDIIFSLGIAMDVLTLVLRTVICEVHDEYCAVDMFSLLALCL